jgi:hypothetical protein
MAEAGHAGDNGFDGGSAERIVRVWIGRIPARRRRASQHKTRVIIWKLATRPRARSIHDSHCSIARRPGGYMYNCEDCTVQHVL